MKINLLYILSVHGSTEFGNLKARSPSAITMDERTATDSSLSKVVKRSGKEASQIVDEVDMNLSNLEHLWD